jgi:hypothetical protein
LYIEEILPNFTLVFIKISAQSNFQQSPMVNRQHSIANKECEDDSDANRYDLGRFCHSGGGNPSHRAFVFCPIGQSLTQNRPVLGQINTVRQSR